MFIVLLKFSTNVARASELMDAHKKWIQRGFDEGVFLMAGSLQARAGGLLLAHGTSLSDLEARVRDDPFVAEDVARPEILEVSPGRMDERLSFLAAPL